MAEAQGSHQRALESRGQHYTFVLAFTALVGGIVLIALGKSAAGLVPLIASIAGLGGLFIYSEVQQKKREKQVREANALARDIQPPST
jgi:hypothetical protein